MTHNVDALAAASSTGLLPLSHFLMSLHDAVIMFMIAWLVTISYHYHDEGSLGPAQLKMLMQVSIFKRKILMWYGLKEPSALLSWMAQQVHWLCEVSVWSAMHWNCIQSTLPQVHRLCRRHGRARKNPPAPAHTGTQTRRLTWPNSACQWVMLMLRVLEYVTVRVIIVIVT